jgi:hypothetical protein
LPPRTYCRLSALLELLGGIGSSGASLPLLS